MATAKKPVFNSEESQEQFESRQKAMPDDSLSVDPQHLESESDLEYAPVENLISMLGGSGASDLTAKVYQVIPGKKDVFLAEMAATDFELSTIQRAYGKGNYRLRVYGFDAKANRVKLHVNQSFEVGAPLEPAEDDATQSGAHIAPGLAEVIGAAVAQAVARVVPVQPQADRLQDALQLLQAMRELASPPEPVKSMRDQLEEYNLLDEIISRKSGNAPEGESMASMMQAGLAVLSQILSAKNGGAPAPDQSQLPGAQQAAPQPEPELTPEERALQANGFLLLQAGRSGVPVEIVADKILELVSDEFILGMFDTPNWWQVVCAMIPGAEEMPQWFEQLHKELLSRYPEEESGINGDASGTDSDGSKPGPVHTGRASAP